MSADKLFTVAGTSTNPGIWAPTCVSICVYYSSLGIIGQPFPRLAEPLQEPLTDYLSQ